MRIPFSHLGQQFADVDEYLEDICALVGRSDFTLGAKTTEFEDRFAAFCGLPHAVGGGSGTDALIISLRLCGVRPGDEVITAANTFIATVGAIAAVGAIPVLVDNEDGFTIDPAKIEAKITERTKAILPVHYSGNVADMPKIQEIADRHQLVVIEDAAQAIGASLNGEPVGSWGRTACFSVHPLKNINVWGDGGLILTRDRALAEELRLYRNHGLKNRDECVMFGVNSRLDTLQATVGIRLIEQAQEILDRRIAVAMHYDAAFTSLAPAIRVPPRRAGARHAFHLYMLRVDRRDALLEHLQEYGIEALIHYPIPIHLQEAARDLGYRQGDFPAAETDAKSIITLPAHQHLEDQQIDYIIESIQEFVAT